MRTRFGMILASALAANATWAEAPKTVNGMVESVKAEEIRVRRGVGNFLAKLNAGKPVTVAYLGGSITSMNGWRNMTTEWLRKTWPESDVTEVHAAIGGTGSSLGVFRLGHDALSKDPDILFVEFATNDRLESAEDIWRNFDGIVQQTWRKNPKTDIVFTYTITVNMLDSYGAGRMNNAASAMDYLADHYGIPSVCFGPRVMSEVKAGRLVMSLGEFATAVPKETPDRDRVINDELKKRGQTLFSKDGVHPALPGHEFYLRSVVAAFEAMMDIPPADHAALVGNPFFDATFAEAKTTPVDESMLVGEGWSKLAEDAPEQKAFGHRVGQFWRADRPGAKLVFRFRGTKCGVYDLLAPKGANVRITVDGKVVQKSFPRFDAACSYTRPAPLWVFEGENGDHDVEIEVLAEQPDRTKVKSENVNTPKYDGTWFQPSHIMVVGDAASVSGDFAFARTLEAAEYVCPSSPLVREKLEWFRDQKLCLMMHFGLYSIWGITESWPLSTKDAFWARADVEWTKDDAEFKRQYFALNKYFNPVRFNGGEIARAAKRCGFRYVAFTTKHHDGFCLYDTKLTDYKTTAPECPYSSNPNADIVKNLFDACRAEGLGVSAYFSKPDFHHDDFWENGGIGIFTTRYPTYDTAKNPEKWARFREFTKGQILELVKGYGPIDMLWLDGGWIRPSRGCDLGMTDIIAAAREIQPDLISVDRAQRDENMNIATPEQTVPEKPLDYPWESCITMSDGWGYHYDDTYKSPRELIHTLVDVVAKGGNLALNVGPMPDGRLPRPALERMEAVGRWLAKNGEAIYGTRAASVASLMKWRFTRAKDGRNFAIRLWKESDAGRVGVLLNADAKQGDVIRVRHLASGLEIPFVESVGDWERGVMLSFPDGFVRDEYADAFEVEYRK